MSDQKQLTLLEKLAKKMAEPEEKEKFNNYLQNIIDKKEHTRSRIQKWIKDKSRAKIALYILKVIDKNGKEWSKKCWAKGYDTYPTNILSSIYVYLEQTFEQIETPSQLECDFHRSTWFFNGFYFCITYGQGSFNSIYDSQFNRLL